MYCMQCEQTSANSGCTAQGICGKLPETSNLQDLLLYVNNGLGQCMNLVSTHASVDEQEQTLGSDLVQRLQHHVLESTFATLTNVNFDEDRIVRYIRDSCQIRDEIKSKFKSLFVKSELSRDAMAPSNYEFVASESELLSQSVCVAGLSQRKRLMRTEDCFGLRECASYGLKGALAYLSHAERMRAVDPSIYTNEERSDLFDTVWNLMTRLETLDKQLDYYLDMCLKVGEMNAKVLHLLDRSHNQMFGVPEPTSVPGVPRIGKGILLSGHDILDVKLVLDAIEQEGLQNHINVYTHGELLPAHSYPELKKYPNLAGHFGTAWQNQPWEFREFPGPIIMTSNCLMPPRRRYKDRLFTTNAVGYDSIKHVNLSDPKQLENVIHVAMREIGFDQRHVSKYEEAEPYLTGFGHAALLSQADVIVDAIQAGRLRDIFVIGGCDGTEKSRNYFTELARGTPDDSIILTLGCGKFRLKDLKLGTLGDSGIPRILDVGQCNDAYSALVVAQKLSEAMETDINHLPLHFAVSWFEQKAVAVFLTLLHFGVKNIRLGPQLPAFLTPGVRKYLEQNMGVRQVNTGDEEDDLMQMLSERPHGARK